jgi:hypothetical protein
LAACGRLLFAPTHYLAGAVRSGVVFGLLTRALARSCWRPALSKVPGVRKSTRKTWHVGDEGRILDAPSAEQAPPLVETQIASDIETKIR